MLAKLAADQCMTVTQGLRHGDQEMVRMKRFSVIDET